MIQKCFARRLLVATAVMLPLVPAQAAGTFTDYFLAPAVTPATPGVHVVNPIGDVTATGASVSSGGVSGGTVSILGRSTFGTAGTSATGSGTGFYGGVFSAWDDTLVVDRPGLTGTRGLTTFDMAMTWTAGVSRGVAPGSAQVETYVDLNVFSNNGIGSQYLMAGDTLSGSCSATSCSSSATGFQPGYVQGVTGSAVTVTGNVAHFTFAFVFGQPFRIWLGVNSFVDGTGVNAFSDASHTAVFGGISSVRDAAGTLVPYAVSSDSGLNYALAVPEPGTTGMLVAGLAALVAKRRLRRR